MLRLDKVIKPWKESAALNDHINLYGFWNETAFLTKSGDLGMVLSVPGVDYESLDRSEQEYAVKRLEAALKAFGPGFHVYQYLFKSNRPDIPFAKYDDPIVEAAVEQRRKFFEAKRDHLYQVEIFYCILLEGARSKSGVGAAIARILRDPAGAVGELKVQFTNDSMKTLLRTHIEHDLRRLDQSVQAFARQLADFMQIEILNQQGQFTFFRRLLNYDAWRVEGKPQSTQFLDYQVVNSDIEAERDHLRVGDHIVRVLTMKEAITETRPLALDALLKIPANFYVVTEWTPLATDKARKEVNKRRRHFNMSKTGFVSQMGNDATKTNPRDVLVDESKQADIENLGDCLRALGDGQSLGDFSLTIVLYGRSKPDLERLGAEFTGLFTNADGNLFAETYNQLNAYFATVPGNYALNLRKLYLLNTNYADLSFLFTILPGEKTNAHLGTEYLAVLETDNSTPYYLNLHTGDVAHTLILGMSGSGKSYLCVFLLQNAQKYDPLTFIFDIGGSFQSLTTIFEGSYLNVGQEARDFTINPFSLPQTKENLQFLFSFFRVLIEGNEQRYRLDFKEERRLWDAIERIYVLEPNQRTVSNFGNIIGELKERLHRWTRGGQYGFLFDNAEDTLSFKSFQTFNFHGWNDAPEVLEPLLFYVLHRASNEITDPKKLGTPKFFLLDEAWLFIKNETIRNYVVQAQKTWRKHKAAMILATQSIKELEESGMLAIVAESCPTKIFLANPDMNREVYREAFHLNDTELDLIDGLVPPGQMLIRKAQTSKKVHLNVDSVSHWMATNNPRDNLKKQEYFDRHGFAEAHRESVGVALHQLEHYTQARIGGNHPPETTGSHYEIGDVVRYARGSKAVGIEAASYASVVTINPTANQLTVEKTNGELATYDPRRLTGVSVYREIDREFSVGDRIQFTAPDKSLGVANRDLAVIESISSDGRVSARLDNNRNIEFSPVDHRHFDHGYAVTSHSAQGLTAERVLIHADTSVHPDLLNSRFAYVSISRASREATLFTDDLAKLSPGLVADISKTSALEIGQTPAVTQGMGIAL